MLQWILHIFIDAAILLVAANYMSKVELKGFKTAIIVALVIGIFSGLIALILNIFTLGLFYFIGLGLIIRIIGNAIIIEIADKVSKDFKTVGFLPSLWLAIILAIVGGIIDAILF